MKPLRHCRLGNELASVSPEGFPGRQFIVQNREACGQRLDVLIHKNSGSVFPAPRWLASNRPDTSVPLGVLEADFFIH